MFAYLLLLLFPMAMAYAAASDLLTLTIPNRISLALIAAFLALAPFAGMTWSVFFQHLGTGGAVLAGGIALFALGLFGGGDAKLLAAAGLWLGPDHMMPFMFNVVVLGGVLSVIILGYRQLVPASVSGRLPAWAERLRNPATGIPYGIAIAGAALMVYPKTLWFLAFGL